MPNSYYTSKDLQRMAREVVKGKGRLIQWHIRISGEQNNEAATLLVDYSKAGWTYQESLRM